MMSPPPRSRHDFKVAIICALPLEAGYVQSVFDRCWEDENRRYGKALGDQNAYTTGMIGRHNVVLAHMPEMGNTSAAAVAAGLRSSFLGIQLAMVVGICGVAPVCAETKEEVILGDVIISTAVIQYDFGRLSSGGFKRKTNIEDSLGRANPEIRASIAKLRTRPNLKRLKAQLGDYLQQLQADEPQARYPGKEFDRLFESSYLHQHRLAGSTCDHCDCGADLRPCSRNCEELGCEPARSVIRSRLQHSLSSDPDAPMKHHPSIHFSRFGSANMVLKSGEERDRLVSIDGFTAFEMEGAGVWDQFPTVVIKGACDYADSHKNKEWQDYAAATAAACAKAFLREWVSSEQTLEEVSNSAPDAFVPFQGHARNVGREGKLDELHQTTSSTDICERGAIYGPDGCGITSLAAEFDQADGPPAKRRKLDSDQVLKESAVHQQSSTQATRPFTNPVTNDTFKKFVHTPPCADYATASSQLSPQKQECLRSLSFPQQEHRYHDIHTAHDTCGWLLDDLKYQAWADGPRGLFWIKGNPGAGKSVLTKFAVKAMREKRPGELISSFFIHGQGKELQHTPLGIFRALLNCMLEHFPEHLTQLTKIFEDRETRFGGYTAGHWEWTVGELQEMLSKVLTEGTTSRPVTIFIDALDECGESPAKSLLTYFSKQAECKSSQVKICVSSRHYPNLGFDNMPAVFVEERNADDITWYTRERLKGIRSDLKPQQLEKEILLKAHGGFQWVLLVTEMVITGDLKGVRLDRLWTELSSCPGTLTELYASMLNGGAAAEQRRMVKVFEWILFAERPLSAQELREALVTDPYMNCKSIAELRAHDGWSDTLDAFEKHIRHVSRGLIQFQTRELWELYDPDGEDWDREAQLIHQSVADYLLDKFLNYDSNSDQRDFRSKAGAGHFRISRSCLRYLTLMEVLNGAQLPREALSSNFPLIPYAVRYVFQHIRKTEEEGVTQLDLLSVIQWMPQCEIVRKLADLWRTCDPDNVHTPLGWPFLGATALHVLTACGSKSAFSSQLDQSIGEVNAMDSDGNTPLMLAIREGHQDIALMLLDFFIEGRCVQKTDEDISGNRNTKRRSGVLLNLNATNNDGDTALTIALDEKTDHVVLRLIEAGAELRHLEQKSALVCCAIHSENSALLDVLLERHIPLDGAVFFASSQQRPIGSGLRDIVRKLLEIGANTARNPEMNDIEEEYENDDEGWVDDDALARASRRGHTEVVSLLLAQGAPPNGQNEGGETPLWVASRMGYTEVINLLLARGASPHLQNENGETPLWVASSMGNTRVIDLLLAHGASPNVQNKQEETPLCVAPIFGGTEVINLLLAHGAWPNVHDEVGRTPLCIASSIGDAEMVNVLLAHGASPDIQDEHWETSLCIASRFGHTEVVDLLLTHGASPNVRDNQEQTPLCIASRYGHKEVVDLLLAHGASAIVQDERGQTPLLIAITNRHETVALSLLKTAPSAAEYKDKKGHSALFQAYNFEQKDLFTVLLTKEYFSNADRRLRRLTFDACRTGLTDMLAIILDTGKVDVDAKDKDGCTPLFIAARCGHEEVVKLLLDTGKVNVDAKTENGKTPLSMARERGHKAVCKLLHSRLPSS